jgi:hypothetical protein
MTTIDPTKPTWVVRGRIAPPDGRRMTVWVNADDEAAARDQGKAEGLGSVDEAHRVNPATGVRMQP